MRDDQLLKKLEASFNRIGCQSYWYKKRDSLFLDLYNGPPEKAIVRFIFNPNGELRSVLSAEDMDN